jgi:hypothetical protein
LVGEAPGGLTRRARGQEWKGHLVDLCVHQFAWLVVAKALTSVDDTVLLNKSVCEELGEDANGLLAMLLVPEGHARKVFLACVAQPERCQGYFEDNDRAVMFQPEPHSSSLKAAEQRRQEVGSKLVPMLLSAMTLNVQQVLQGEGKRTLPSDVLRECLAWPEVAGSGGEERALMVSRLADEAGGLMEDIRGHLLLKRVLKDEAALSSVPDRSFAKALLDKLKGKWSELAKVNRACFVLEALLAHPHTAASVRKALKVKGVEFGDKPGCVALKEKVFAA